MAYEWVKYSAKTNEIIKELNDLCKNKSEQSACRCPLHRAAERLNTLQARNDYLESLGLGRSD